MVMRCLTVCKSAAGDSLAGGVMVNVSRSLLAHKSTASLRNVDAGQLHLRVRPHVLREFPVSGSKVSEVDDFSLRVGPRQVEIKVVGENWYRGIRSLERGGIGQP